MRRIIFYLSVALLAFGIGSFVVFKFCWKPAEQSITTQATEVDNVSKLEIKNDSMQFEMKDDLMLRKFKEDKVDDSKEVILKNLPCKDKKLRLVWNKIKNDFPDAFNKMAVVSRKMNVKLIRDKSIRIFLDEIVEGVGNYKDEPEIQCGIFCEMAEKELMI